MTLLFFIFLFSAEVTISKTVELPTVEALKVSLKASASKKAICRSKLEGKLKNLKISSPLFSYSDGKCSVEFNLIDKNRAELIDNLEAQLFTIEQIYEAPLPLSDKQVTTLLKKLKAEVETAAKATFTNNISLKSVSITEDSGSVIVHNSAFAPKKSAKLFIVYTFE